MTVPVRIVGENLADIGIVTTSSAVTSLPASNLKTEDIQQLWRAETSAVQSIVVDVAAQSTIGFVGLINSNAREGALAQVRVSVSDATGASGDAYNSGEILAGVDPAYRIFAHFLPAEVTGRHVRIDLNQSDRPEAGRLVVGNTWTPTYSFSYGWEPLYRDPSRRVYSIGRNVFTDRLSPERGMRFTLRGLSESEANLEIEDINRLRGTSQDVLVCRDINASNIGRATIWGLLEQPISYPQREEGFVAEFEVWARS